ncbi:hypothetical protein G6F31_015339 [Rhizopus arrhizus]|nr:hypothetical protein G6F31_015339 [Rhizopus arrhizus]
MRPWQELGRDCLAEARGVGGAQSALQEPVDQLQQALLALRAAMDGLPSRGTQWRALAMPQVRDGFDTVMAGLMTLEQALQPLREAAAGLDACHARAREAVSRLSRWLGDDEPSLDFDTDPADVAGAADVLWYELTSRGFRCQRTPMDVSGPLREHRERSRAAWIFTSATLTVGAESVQLARAGAVLPARRPARSGRAWLRHRVDPDPAAGAAGVAGQGIPAVRVASRPARSRRGTARRAVAVVRAGRGTARDPAAALPRIGQWRAARLGQFPRGRGRGRR